jgi:hypothetical protein
MISLQSLLYIVVGGLLLWVIFAIRLSYAAKKRANGKEKETFEKRDN